MRLKPDQPCEIVSDGSALRLAGEPSNDELDRVAVIPEEGVGERTSSQSARPDTTIIQLLEALKSGLDQAPARHLDSPTAAC